ncbi:hypothetical protein HY604_05420 [Candidatus Peregrinibacteria bacterium]|nr:hypothetical protein [Candidatus Peregrinibacteria bacterium]
MADTESFLWKRVDRCLPILQIVPFVKMVAVCNNLAFSTVNEKSDIDLFVIAKLGRLFFVRSMITFLLQVLGVRRYGDKVSGRFCLSFFVDEDALDLSTIAIEDDIYLVYWLWSMLPVIENEKGFSDRFLAFNSWANDYFENRENLALRRERMFSKNVLFSFFRKSFEFLFGGRVGNFIENLLQSWQLKRALLKAQSASFESSLVINEHMLKFHNVDRRRKYRRAWFDTYGKEKLSDQKFRAMKSIF